MTRQEHIDDVINNKIRPLLMEASDIIEAQKPGDKIPVTQLAKIVAERHGTTGPALYNLIRMIIDDYPNRRFKRGAHGGVEYPLPETVKGE